MGNLYKVDIVFPVYNKNIDILERSAARTMEHLKTIRGPYDFRIVISINGPQAESIITKAEEICRKYAAVSYLYTPEQGKGRGVLNAWENSGADILTYMDIDLATSLESFESLIDEIKEGADISVGSRYLPGSKLKRTLRRLVLSRIYHLIFINFFLSLPISDVQCGFKAVSKNAFRRLSPYIHDRIWFFEAEMLYLAHRMKMKISQVPVFWTECTVSGLKLVKTSALFIVKVAELKTRYLFRNIERVNS